MRPRRHLLASLLWVSLAIPLGGASCVLVFDDPVVGGGGSTSGGGGTGAMGGAGTSSTGGAGGVGGGAPSKLPDGSACSSDGDCEHDHCVVVDGGGGNVCCAEACLDGGAEKCGQNGACLASGSACAIYADGTTCGFISDCKGAKLTSERCRGGACALTTGPCEGQVKCANNDVCKEGCVTVLDCATLGAQCVDGVCMQPIGAPCDSDNQCDSGACGTTGTGHCCAPGVVCSLGGTCGATDCDGTGACEYPKTSCGAGSTCDGNTLTTQYCDGMGACQSGLSTYECPGFLVCADETACLVTCGSDDAAGDARCTAGHWCDGSACRDPRPILFPCNRPTQCNSGNCDPTFSVCGV